MNYLSILLVIAAFYASNSFQTHHQPKSYNKLKLVTNIKPITSSQYVSNFDKLPLYRTGITF